VLVVATSQRPLTDIAFADLGLDPRINDTLASAGIEHPFPIQAEAIPLVLAGRDICGKAKTGSGKTFAFGLPTLQRLVPGGGTPQALVLVPTRELCVQVASELRPFAKALGLSVAEVYGGVSIGDQIDHLKRGAEMVVATPGRLIDLQDRGAIRYDDVKVVILDEADQMADMGFLPQTEYIWRQVPDGHQSLLFSATLDGGIDHLVNRRLTDPAYSEVTNEAVSVEQMEHRFLLVHHRDKPQVVARVTTASDRVLVFVHTKHGCDRVADQLRAEGVDAAALHGGLPQQQRQKVLDRFSEGKLSVLVATNVAARGLDIEDIELVVHYDPPEDAKTYLHRSGRTARAGRPGMVVTLVEWDQEIPVRTLQNEAGLDHEMVKLYSNDARLDDLWAWDPPRRDLVAERADRKKQRRGRR
jgi:superfamily II DNA/RNA helicase